MILENQDQDLEVLLTVEMKDSPQEIIVKSFKRTHDEMEPDEFFDDQDILEITEQEITEITEQDNAETTNPDESLESVIADQDMLDSSSESDLSEDDFEYFKYLADDKSQFDPEEFIFFIPVMSKLVLSC